MERGPLDRPLVARPSRTARPRFGDPALLAAICAGGVVGALVRAEVDELAPAPSGGFPWSELALNVLGTGILVYAATRLQERLPPSTYRRPFVGTGFCGALTTFSTLQLRVVELGRNGHPGLALGYLAVSTALGLLAAGITIAATRRARLR